MSENGRRERKKAETRERILEAGLELFRKKGYRETSMMDITEAADVAPRTFYQHFASKADVALEQLMAWVDGLVTALEERPLHEEPLEMMAGALEVMRSKGYLTDEVRRREDGTLIVPIGTALWWSDENIEIAGRLLQIVVETWRRLTKIFEERMDAPSGALEPRIRAGALVATWFVSANSLQELAETTPEPPSLDALFARVFLAYWQGVEHSTGTRESAEPPAKPRGGRKTRYGS